MRLVLRAASCCVPVRTLLVTTAYRLVQSAMRPPPKRCGETCPVLLLGRLAVDKRYHNQGIGQALLRDAMMRAVNVSGDAGVFAILVHALSNQAKQFYLSRGFVESPLQPMTLIMTIETVRSILAEPD